VPPRAADPAEDPLVLGDGHPHAVGPAVVVEQQRPPPAELPDRGRRQPGAPLPSMRDLSSVVGALEEQTAALYRHALGSHSVLAHRWEMRWSCSSSVSPLNTSLAVVELQIASAVRSPYRSRSWAWDWTAQVMFTPWPAPWETGRQLALQPHH
jgi:hypothetical protein